MLRFRMRQPYRAGYPHLFFLKPHRQLTGYFNRPEPQDVAALQLRQLSIFIFLKPHRQLISVHLPVEPQYFAAPHAPAASVSYCNPIVSTQGTLAARAARCCGSTVAVAIQTPSSAHRVLQPPEPQDVAALQLCQPACIITLI